MAEREEREQDVLRAGDELEDFLETSSLGEFYAGMAAVMAASVSHSLAMEDMLKNPSLQRSFRGGQLEKDSRSRLVRPGNCKLRGVTLHRRTQRFEAHIWEDRKQVYLGGYEKEEEAAKAHDVFAIKCRGVSTVTNYMFQIYLHMLPILDKHSNEAVVQLLRKYSRDKTRLQSSKRYRLDRRGLHLDPFPKAILPEHSLRQSDLLPATSSRKCPHSCADPSDSLSIGSDSEALGRSDLSARDSDRTLTTCNRPATAAEVTSLNELIFYPVQDICHNIRAQLPDATLRGGHRQQEQHSMCEQLERQQQVLQLQEHQQCKWEQQREKQIPQTQLSGETQSMRYRKACCLGVSMNDCSCEECRGAAGLLKLLDHRASQLNEVQKAAAADSQHRQVALLQGGEQQIGMDGLSAAAVLAGLQQCNELEDSPATRKRRHSMAGELRPQGDSVGRSGCQQQQGAGFGARGIHGWQATAPQEGPLQRLHCQPDALCSQHPAGPGAFPKDLQEAHELRVRKDRRTLMEADTPAGDIVYLSVFEQLRMQCIAAVHGNTDAAQSSQHGADTTLPVKAMSRPQDLCGIPGSPLVPGSHMNKDASMTTSCDGHQYSHENDGNDPCPIHMPMIAESLRQKITENKSSELMASRGRNQPKALPDTASSQQPYLPLTPDRPHLRVGTGAAGQELAGTGAGMSLAMMMIGRRQELLVELRALDIAISNLIQAPPPTLNTREVDTSPGTPPGRLSSVEEDSSNPGSQPWPAAGTGPPLSPLQVQSDQLPGLVGKKLVSELPEDNRIMDRSQHPGPYSIQPPVGSHEKMKTTQGLENQIDQCRKMHLQHPAAVQQRKRLRDCDHEDADLPVSMHCQDHHAVPDEMPKLARQADGDKPPPSTNAVPQQQQQQQLHVEQVMVRQQQICSQVCIPASTPENPSGSACCTGQGQTAAVFSILPRPATTLPQTGNSSGSSDREYAHAGGCNLMIQPSGVVHARPASMKTCFIPDVPHRTRLASLDLALRDVPDILESSSLLCASAKVPP